MQRQQATLLLFIHYYGNKNAIHELEQLRAMPFLCQSLYGMDTRLLCHVLQTFCPHWQISEWEIVAPISNEIPIYPQ